MKNLSLFTTITLVFWISGCKPDPTPLPLKLELIESYSLDIKEPSGLTFGEDKETFYTVSDKQNKIFKVDKNGKILKTLAFKGDDLEGIVYIPTDGSIWVVEEQLSQIIHLDSLGNKVDHISLAFGQTESKHGMEGITWHPLTQHFFVVTEKSPSLLIEIDQNGKKINEFTLNFAKDYSGITYDSKEDVLYIISDESKTLTKCDLSGSPITSFSLGLEKIEGIVRDSKNGHFYLVSDKTNEFLIFK